MTDVFTFDDEELSELPELSLHMETLRIAPNEDIPGICVHHDSENDPPPAGQDVPLYPNPHFSSVNGHGTSLSSSHPSHQHALDGDKSSAFSYNGRLQHQNSLNYRMLPELEDEAETDPVLELPKPVPIRQHRRNSSHAIDINDNFVSSISKSYSSDQPSVPYKPKLLDFEPIKVLGRGSFGKVYLVREVSTGRLFALKQLKKATLIVSDDEVDPVNYQRTVNEKSILEMVDHPNIVRLYYAFQDHNKLYLILEYLDGGELFHHLAQERFMSEKNAAYYIAQMVLALRYLHTQLGVIYRDLKPENCMLNSLGNLVLTDFGLSKVSSDDDKSHSLTGTAQYMAPEILKGENYGFAVDWWSLGCVAFDLLTGSPPFTGNNNKKIMDKIVSSKKHLKFPFYLSLDAKDLLRKLLQANPDKRMDPDTKFETIKNHRFFRHMDWKQLESCNLNDILPPILPVITNPVLAENFDPEFTDLPFTPHTDLASDILHVKGFTFANESYLANYRS